MSALQIAVGYLLYDDNENIINDIDVKLVNSLVKHKQQLIEICESHVDSTGMGEIYIYAKLDSSQLDIVNKVLTMMLKHYFVVSYHKSELPRLDVCISDKVSKLGKALFINYMEDNIRDIDIGYIADNLTN